ncbi:hypothetical protein H312_03340 [Anncaliia algerae PRA339]|uniref:ABC transporter domain-containing protein n=1 Tax=Anncaliia algerae PRA339 TaxID=1288291 RepID=A0A059EWG5_9MICR|nr:hypothetical protein H312_03340 [Anncaliia algerae PRA339]
MLQFKELSWYNLTIEVKNNNNIIRILDNVSGKAEAGRMHIIMGPSGSGKSTLINTLMGHVPFEFRTSGEILVDDMERKNTFKSMVGLCDQQDIYFDYYTAFDFLKFHSFGKNRNFDENESEERINFLLKRLALDEKRDTLVSKLSGGERKRLVLISELMTKKKIIFLDEPTSGLDSHLALSLIVFLKEITIKDNLLMFVTIHQPSPTIVNMFDDFTFIAWGRVLYHGEYAKCEQYFADHGFVKPSHITFTEYLFELTCEKSCFDEIVPNLDKVQSLLPPNDSSPVNSNKSNYIFETKVNKNVVFALIKRMLINYFKNTNILTKIASLIFYVILIYILFVFRKEVSFSYRIDNVAYFYEISLIVLLVSVSYFSCFMAVTHQRCIAFSFKDSKLLKSEIKNDSYSVTELLIALVLLCMYTSLSIFILITVLINIISFKLFLLVFVLFLPLIVINTFTSVLISFFIPFVAPIILFIIHAYPFMIKNMFKVTFSSNTNDLSKISYGSLLVLLGITIQFIPGFLYVNLIKTIYFKGLIWIFSENSGGIKNSLPKNVQNKLGLRSFMLFLSGHTSKNFSEIWRFFLAALILLFIMYLLAIKMIYSLKVKLLIPFRYKLKNK